MKFKHIQNSKDFFSTLNESTNFNPSYKEGLKILGGAKEKVEYIILDIPNYPKHWSTGKNARLTIYVPSTKRYCFIEKNSNITDPDDEFVSLQINKASTWKGKTVEAHINVEYSTTNPYDILNQINLANLQDDLSDDAHDWMMETIMSEDILWEDVIKNLVEKGPMTDKDFEVLKIDKHHVRGIHHGKEYDV